MIQHLQRIFIWLFLMVLLPFTTISAQTINELKNEMLVREFPLPIYYSEPRTKPITHIVIHSISNVVSKPESPFSMVDIYYLLMEYGVSTHYVIDREGDIFLLVPENRVAYHAGRSGLPNLPFFAHNMNEYSIGIELMGIGLKEEIVPSITEEMYDNLDSSYIGFTEEQYDSLTSLLDMLHIRYPTIPKSKYHIIGHEDYATNRKVDPGKLFKWSKLGYE